MSTPIDRTDSAATPNTAQSNPVKRRKADTVDVFLSQAGFSPDGESFFAALARFLAQSLQMDFVSICRLAGVPLTAVPLSSWADGQFHDYPAYRLQDTPGVPVLAQGLCCYADKVCQLFPNDGVLNFLQAESYVGITLKGHTGQAIGLITVAGRSKLINPIHAEATLARVALRAAGELERLDAAAVLHTSETRFRSLVENIPNIAVQGYAKDGTVLFWNAACEKLYGYSPEDALGGNLLDLIIPTPMREGVKAAVEHMLDSGEPIPMGELQLRRKDGSMVDVLSSHALVTPANQPAEMFCLDFDLTERKQSEAKLQLAASVFQHAREGIIITDSQGCILDVNDTFTRITGYCRDDVVGRNASLFNSGRQEPAFYAVMGQALNEQGHWSGEIWNKRKDGEIIAVMVTTSAVRDTQGITQQYVALFSDVTAIKANESMLDRMAHFDALTGLPNRLLLGDRLHQGMAQATRRGETLAVVFLDLDGFKAINDRLGHEAGDLVLIAVANRMKQALREVDTLARIGGDEFVAVLPNLTDPLAGEPLLKRLMEAAAQPVSIGDQSVSITASVGMSFFPQAQDIAADQLLRQADQAMYQSKIAGKNRYQIFDAAHDNHLRDSHESLKRIGLAVEKREFVLHYQPKVNMRTGKVIGAEALIRWQHPEKGLLSPATFLPLIEDHPLAVTVGEWVINAALIQVALWQAQGLDMPVSVNIGARQLQQTDFVDHLRGILAAHPAVPQGKLELEVLETSALEDIAQVSQVIEACTAMGVMFALDDFGTGYSSLTYLKRLRVALLKIDQSFVRDMLEDPDDLAILEGVIGLAAAFKRKVIAEGVETAAHGSLLLKLGCELAQGYGIARPMPADQLPAWVVSWRPDPSWSDPL